MAKLSPARRAARSLVSERRRRNARMRDLLRGSRAFEELDPRDRALAFRLAMGATGAQTLIDELLDERMQRASRVQPLVRDALRVAAFEVLWLSTPGRVAVSQGVELVRSVSRNAAGLANAVLRRLLAEVRPQVEAARERCERESWDECDLVLVSGLPAWLVHAFVCDRGLAGAAALCLRNLEPPLTYVAVNRARHTVAQGEALLVEAGLEPKPVGPQGCFALARGAGLVASGLVEDVDVVPADLAAQMVAALVAPDPGSKVLEVGQGRGTKSLLLESAALAAGDYATIAAVDSEAYKTQVSERRMERAGLASWVQCHTLDATLLSHDELPSALDTSFDLVFLDAPCSGSGTMARHPEIASSLDARAVSSAGELPQLQLALLKAASTRVRAGGVLAYSTCSALRVEDEYIVRDFLAAPEGARFVQIPATERVHVRDTQLAQQVTPWLTPEGYLLTGLEAGGPGAADTHFLALLEARD